MSTAHAEFARRLLPGTAWGLHPGGGAGPPQAVAAIGAAWPGERGKSCGVVESRLSDEILRATMCGLEGMARGRLKGCFAPDIDAEDVAQECSVRLLEKGLAADAALLEGPHGGTLRHYARNVTLERLDERKRRREVACADIDELEAPAVRPDDEPGSETLSGAQRACLVCLTRAERRATERLAQLGSLEFVAQEEHTTARAIARRLRTGARRTGEYREHALDVAALDPDLPAPHKMLALSRAGWTQGAIADEFHMTEGAVKQAVFRARHPKSDAA